jgi:hypothetical protein
MFLLHLNKKNRYFLKRLDIVYPNVEEAFLKL